MRDTHDLWRIPRWRRLLIVTCAAALALGFGTSFMAMSSPIEPSKGLAPSEAFPTGQPPIRTLMPDYVEALDRSGNAAGYVRADMLVDRELVDETLGGWIPVYDESLQRVVGHMVDGYGFIPLGGRLEDFEPFERVETFTESDS
jgi:hypothetical protein